MFTLAPSLERKPSSNRVYNAEMLLVQTIGIIAVVMGHGAKQVPSLFFSLFPIYSWHMPLFIFVSGYFFSRGKPFLELAKHKTLTLLLPALGINLLYGLFCELLRQKGIIAYGSPIDLHSLLIRPFQDGYQFGLNVSFWFIFQLYIIELLTGAIWRFQSKRGATILLAVSAALSLGFCYIAHYKIFNVSSGWALTVSRTFFLWFFYVLGRYYRDYLEDWLERHKVVILVVLVGIQLLLMCFFRPTLTINPRNMNMSGVSTFFTPILTALSTTAVLLCAAKMLKPSANGKIIHFFGANTKAIVYHHQLCFFLLNSVFAIVKRTNLISSFQGLPTTNIQYHVWQVFQINGTGLSELLYALVGLIMPVAVSKWISGYQSRLTRGLLWAAVCAFIAIPFLFL